ncbi:hypothetical protein [Kitasatospora aureofaciens]|uniref:hypothetical protein n=1 Tax=Kitasatospora aureofaciens TaxID=1894 RepID=UPI0038288141
MAAVEDTGTVIVVPPGRAVERVFSAPVLAVFLVQPVLGVGQFLYRYGPEQLAPIGLVFGIPMLLVLLGRCARPHFATRIRAEMWWLAQATARYIACCATPLFVPMLIGMAQAPACRVDDGCYQGDPGCYAAFIGMFILWVTVPALVLLFLLAPHALRGRRVRTLFALLTNLLSALFLLAGFAPVLLLIGAQAVYAWAFLPVAPRPTRAGTSRP